MNSNPYGWLVPASAGLAVGLLIAAADAFHTDDANANRGLNAVLYMQTAAEYRACCLQAYNLATLRLDEKLKALPSGGKPPAVVVDLDETVFDNAGYESYLVRTNQTYSDDTWKRWVRTCTDEVGLVPGAKEFIAAAQAKGVAVVYITNRFASDRAYTVKALEHTGLESGDVGPRLMLFQDGDPTTSKDGRRKEATDAYRVLLWFGDNLRDFSDDFKYDPKAGVAGRAKAVDDRRARWGDDWIVLPNPAYGEWTKAFGASPADALRPTALGAK